MLTKEKFINMKLKPQKCVKANTFLLTVYLIDIPTHIFPAGCVFSCFSTFVHFWLISSLHIDCHSLLLRTLIFKKKKIYTFQFYSIYVMYLLFNCSYKWVSLIVILYKYSKVITCVCAFLAQLIWIKLYSGNIININSV